MNGLWYRVGHCGCMKMKIREVGVTCLTCGHRDLKAWPDTAIEPNPLCLMTCRCCNNETMHEWSLIPEGTLWVTDNGIS